MIDPIGWSIFFLALFYAFSIIPGSILAVSTLIFAPPNLTLILVGAICGVLGVLGMVKLYLVTSGRLNNTSVIDMGAKNMVIGFGGCTLCGFVSQVALFVISENPKEQLIAVFVFFYVTTAIFTLLFLTGTRTKVVYHEQFSFIIVFLNIVFFLSVQAISAYFDQGPEIEIDDEVVKRFQRNFLHLLYSIVYTPCVLDYCSVLWNGVKEADEELDEESYNPRYPHMYSSAGARAVHLEEQVERLSELI